jgi:serine/threonine protein kinase
VPGSIPIVRFARFEVLSRIGIGGMGEVFHARLRKHGRSIEVALKLIRPEFADETRFRDMFLAEAHIGALLDHPNVARVVDAGEVEGVLYLATELVDGISLAGLTSAALPLPLIAYIMRCLLDALAYVHSLHDQNGHPLGLVHRDVSLSNVLVSRAGKIKLTDFGVHKTSGTARTMPGEFKGKPAFMAPEQLPNGGEIDQRADLFAAGVILHMLTYGHGPFNDVSTWLAEGAPLSLDGPLAEVIAHALAPDAHLRVATAHALIDEIARVVPDDPTAASLLSQIVRERAKPERPIGAIERLIMSELEPAHSTGLVYAPDPTTDRLFVISDSRALEIDNDNHDDDDDFASLPTRLLADPLTEKPRLPPLLPAVDSAVSIALVPSPPVPRPPPLVPTGPALEAVPSALQPLPSSPVARIPLEPESLRPARSRWPLWIVLIGAATLGLTIVGVQLFPAHTATTPKPPPEPAKPARQPKPRRTASTPPSSPSQDLAEPRAVAPTPPKPKSRPKPVVETPPDRPTGYLTLDTDPWATVYLGGRKLGTTPFMRVPLPAGHHKLVLDIKNSGERLQREVDIAPGEVKRLGLRLR